MRKLIFISVLFISAFAHGQFAMLDYSTQKAVKFGALISNAGNTVTDKAIIARDSLKLKWVRSKINIFSWTGNSNTFDDYDAAGLNQLVVFGTFQTGTPQHWITDPADLAAYATTCGAACRKYPKIRVAIVDNEEITDVYPDNDQTAYHIDGLDKYLTQCLAIKDTLHKYNVKMCDGGIYGVGLNMYTYRWLKTKYGQSTADDFGSRCMTGAQISAANTVNSNPTLEFYPKQIDTILSSNVFDIYNIHPYQPYGNSTRKDTITVADFTVLRYTKECIESVTGKPCISNENGIRSNNTSTDFMLSYEVNWYRLGFEYNQYWAGTNTTLGTQSLTDDNGSPTPTGIVFKIYQQARQQ
jgi:hypothetical protein